MTQLSKSIAVLSLSAVLLGLSGCGGGASLPKNTDRYNYEDSSTFVLMDARAQRSVTSSGIQQVSLPDGRLEVAANLRNRENRRIEVQWQIVFKDAQGFETEATPWKTVILTENGQETVRAASMNAQAKRYTVRVREAR
jgi:uncharacterized protein YcfL